MYMCACCRLPVHFKLIPWNCVVLTIFSHHTYTSLFIRFAVCECLLQDGHRMWKNYVQSLDKVTKLWVTSYFFQNICIRNPLHQYTSHTRKNPRDKTQRGNALGRWHAKIHLQGGCRSSFNNKNVTNELKIWCWCEERLARNELCPPQYRQNHCTTWHINN